MILVGLMLQNYDRILSFSKQNFHIFKFFTFVNISKSILCDFGGKLFLRTGSPTFM